MPTLNKNKMVDITLEQNNKPELKMHIQKGQWDITRTNTTSYLGVVLDEELE